MKYNMTIFRCNPSFSVSTLPKGFYKYSKCSEKYNIYYGPPNIGNPPGFKWPSVFALCSTIQVAIVDKPADDPFEFLTDIVTIEVQLSDDCEKCLHRRRGQCQLHGNREFYCTEDDGSLAWKLGLGKVPSCPFGQCLPDLTSNPCPESANVYFGVPVFTYKDLEVATQKFDPSRELGKGGFGIVYHGKLQDGREVAVKRLYEHNYRRVEQFMNEIKILTCLRHKNLVSLYGYTSCQSRELLLVYEYISNGTVASHLRCESTNPGFLSWPTRMKVAIETATALAYLHASEIIHRDVKTNNILLDNTFCVKVADFGLSRLFPNDVTHVSTAPQGTPGYVDPEYHRCYQLTSKSDVYSFGVVLTELISSMPAVDMSRHMDEINLADLAIRKIQKNAVGELMDPSLGFESDDEVKRKITLVAELAFQCLQRNKELRPSMDEVLEVLVRIESGNNNDVDHPLSPSSPDHDEVKLLKNSKLTPSPKTVTDKWDSESTTTPVVVSAEDRKCPPSFDCGIVGEIKFPFTTTQQRHCGLLAIGGCEDPIAPKTIQLSNSTLKVLRVEPRTIAIKDEGQQHYLRNRSCGAFSNNFTQMPHASPLASFYLKYNITLFRCKHSLNFTLPKTFHNYSTCHEYNIYYWLPNTEVPLGFKWPESLASCSKIHLAVSDDSTRDPFEFLSDIISIEVQLSGDCEKCLHGSGQCQLDLQGKLFCAKAEHKSLAWKLGAGIGIGIPGIIIVGLLIIWYRKSRFVPNSYSNPYAESISVNYGVPVFTYKDLQVATKNFDHSRELGEGGFGIVYYGKLHDGREVAVKRLYEHNYKRVEQFMNEIKILTRLRHKNLVSLYGCTSRHSRELLLVYEYISNGTVANHLPQESTNPSFLSWPTRMKVAIETATALAYLHASEIIHRDVKTNNILLDNTFCVKVADFGLSRLFPNDVTHVSTAPQGTPGYVDPEYHRCYQLTSKSDVYSFGVVLIELISSMPAVDM
ncbi:hypothetical protein RJT34_25507 [Clitoria ternatea]|uniref:Protein kinase domain-containing protein n=1 Tax=Clitoria ternatea TaxID=43366 RepID=A0AAN9FXZ9_CLITE